MITKFNKYNFLKEGYSDYNQFSQAGANSHGLGPGYGFAIDNKLSIYGSQDSPYTDQYARTPMFVNQLLGIMKQANKDVVTNYGAIKYDQFLEDIDEFTDMKILRLNVNNSLSIDVFISFFFGEEEFFGVFKKFNWVQKEEFKTDLFTDGRYSYIDKEYRLKLDNYFRKVLDKWFKPKKGNYISLKEVPCRDKMGAKFMLPNKANIEVVYSNDDKDGNSFIEFKYKNESYVLNKNDYYFFNYWFEKIEDTKKPLK